MAVLVNARFAPSITVVVAVWVLLSRFESLSELSTALALTTDGPGTVTRQVSTMVRASERLGPMAPRLHATVGAAAAVSTQFCDAGEADTNAAPLGTVKLRRLLAEASTALLSMRSV